MKADDVIINGDRAKEATKHLQESSDLLTFSRDGTTGKISAEQTTSGTLTEKENVLMRAITDPNKIVNLDATSSNEITIGNTVGNLILGAYAGSSAITPNILVGNQSVNTDQAELVEGNGGNTASQTVVHEILESYTSMKIGNGIHQALTPNGDATYSRAHAFAKSLDKTYSDQGVHKDTKNNPGYNTYWHENPSTGNPVVLFKSLP